MLAAGSLTWPDTRRKNGTNSLAKEINQYDHMYLASGGPEAVHPVRTTPLYPCYPSGIRSQTSGYYMQRPRQRMC